MSRHLELQLQISVVRYLRHALPETILWWHTPNGGAREKREAAKLKAMGVKPDVPDLLFLMPTGKLAAIELKVDKGRLSPEQTVWLKAAEETGAWVAICRTPEEVEDTLRRWLQPFGYQIRATLRRAA